MINDKQAHDVASRINRAFVKATAREPNDKELALLVKLYQESLSAYTVEDTAAANALVTTGGHTPPPTDEIPFSPLTIQSHEPYSTFTKSSRVPDSVPEFFRPCSHVPIDHQTVRDLLLLGFGWPR